MTRRRWIADQWDEATAVLSGEQAGHLVRVLRAQEGMEYDIVAGGRVWHGVVASVSPGEVRFNLVAEVTAEPALPVTLLLSIFKFDRMEWAIEKATELGVESIVPMIARRSEKHLALTAGKRVERWRRIAHEAAQQSRRSDVPIVEEAAPLKDAARASSQSARFVLAEQECGVTLRQAVDELLAASGDDLPKIRIAVGPEGGWANEEAALWDAEGWKAVSLGPRILRAETAAITALSVVASMLE
jgi:16S rRNA (uracil1498-N3)-methyltransferase